jgi:predicted metal-dependent HD superfamily phosphohydrolase
MKMHASLNAVTFDEYSKLVVAYTEPTRDYHGISHIYKGLAYLNDFNSQVRHDINIDVVTRAFFFHDAFYSPYYLNGENEAISAEMAVSPLYSTHKNEILKFAINATAKHTSDQDFSWLAKGDQAAVELLLDVDMAEMGCKLEQFYENGEKIRHEYSYVDTQTFNKARLNFLQMLNERKRIYYTPFFYEKYESSCRSNIKNCVEMLEALIHQES